MTNLQENRVSMYFTVKDFLVPYTAITNVLPNYSANYVIFLNAIPQIQAISVQQKASKKGYADQKHILRQNLVIQTEDCTRKMTVYAKFTNNAILAQEMHITETKLRKAADTSLRDYSQLVYDRVQSNLPALSTYGITAAGQASFLLAINAYNASLGKPAAGRTEAGQITRQLKAAFKVADTALEIMDTAVELIKTSQPVFYKSYKNARKIIATGGSPLALTGHVSNSNGEALKGVTLSFVLTEGSKVNKTKVTKPLVKKSAAKGGFRIKSLAPGRYTVIAQKIGYEDHTTTVDITNGELANLKIKLSKN